MKLPLYAVLFTAALSPLAFAADAPDTSTQPETSTTVGLGVAYVPEYAGAKKSRAFPLLAFEYANANGLFASSQKGIGYQTKAGPVNLSAALGYDVGRRERDSNVRFGSKALKGMGDIRGSALLGLGIGYDFGFVSVGLQSNLALSHRERGNEYELAAQVPLLADDADKVGLFFSADYSDKKNSQTFYGVTAQQSLRSGYKVYTPKAGFTKAALGVSWNHTFNKNWSLNTMAGAMHMLGDAADSPLTARKTAPVLLTTVNYTFK
ncbi:MAG: MipA/OmpV family protein [Gammaproteobacteria bacterium]